MGTNTDRLALFKPDYSDSEAVIPDINNNFEKIDDLINANLFTSSTRPLNPHHGRLIYETDTKLLAIFLVGTGWLYIGGDGFARGKKAVITADGDSATTTNNVEIGPFISITFNSESGRRYFIESAFCLGYLGASGGITGMPRLRWAAGISVTTGGTQLGSDIFANVVYPQGSSQDFFIQTEFVPNIDGNITVGLFLSTGSATKNIFFDQAPDRSAFLLARDVGAE